MQYKDRSEKLSILAYPITPSPRPPIPQKGGFPYVGDFSNCAMIEEVGLALKLTQD
ncbi:hypothetical protein [Oscillatoria sp. FACHB-1406]|uniref:hypothetical protein n=1 Tax=Oscillatoria sp. FACHB-1406 TaxID=2692846 RepID=UPI0016890D4C|nr:hypothetical protein [Oscillatoria sp. FACHB-1406]MBD2577720.1 hypothetical protein [Oscillatoria sp. FACHB-1406]